jgi:hypothetical protein
MNEAVVQQSSDATRDLVQRFQTATNKIREQVRGTIVGQDEVVENLLVTLFVGGHCLITGMPGTAKTLLVHTLATALGLTFKRIQFTPDLMPVNATGALCPARCSPTCCWPTRSTEPRPKPRRRCSKRCRKKPSPCAV